MKSIKHISSFLLQPIAVATCLTSCAVVASINSNNLNPEIGAEQDVPANLLKYDDTTVYGLADGVTIEDLFLNGYTNLNLKDGHLGKRITKIAPYAFASIFAGDASSVKHIELPDTITEIGQGAFYFCPALEGTLLLPKALKKIGQDAFFYANNISGDLKIPEGVESIGAQAFWGMSSLTGTLTIPASVKEVGYRAFAHREALENIHQLDLSAFERIPSWLFKQGTIFQNIGTGTNLTVKARATENTTQEWTDALKCQGVGENVTVVDTAIRETTDNCFKYEDSGQTITGFADDFNIKDYNTLKFPTNVNKIKSEAFKAKIKGGTLKFEMPSNITTYGDSAFEDCPGLICNNMIIPDTATSIGKYAFRNCTGLTGTLSFTSTSDKFSIQGEEAFAGCTGLHGLKPMQKVCFDGKNMFKGCSAMSIIDFTDYANVQWEHLKEQWPQTDGGKALDGLSAGGMLFYDPDRLEWNIFDFKNFFGWATNIDTDDVDSASADPSSRAKWQVQTYPTNGEADVPEYEGFIIKNNEQCYGISANLPKDICDYNTVKIPTTVTSIETGAFKDVLQPKADIDRWELKLNLGISTIKDSAFENCTGIVNSLVIPGSVQTIGDKSFYNCSNITGGLILPESVTSIGSESFASTRITYVKIDSSMKSIGSKAFNNLKFMKVLDLSSFASVPSDLSVGDNAFSFGSSSGVVYITSGTKSGWQSKLKGLPSGWSFKEI